MPSMTRRQALATVGATGTALAGCLGRGTASGDLGPVEGRWPMVGSDSGHTRRVASGPTDPERVWSTELVGARAATTPAVDDGSLYVPVDAVTDVARHRYRVHALHAADGTERWQVPLRAEPTAPPATSGDRVVVTGRPSLERGRVVCFERRYGDEEWLFDVDARLTAAPTVADGTVYVPDWGGRVHAVWVADGTRRWARRVGDTGESRSFAAPAAVADGAVYLGSRAGETGVVALDAVDGGERWRRDTDAVTAGPVADGDLVVVRCHGLVVAFDADGERRWSFNTPDAVSRPVALGDRHVYVAVRRGVVAITRSGEHAWTYELSAERGGTPTVVGDTVLVRGQESLVALAGATGEEQWSAGPGGLGGPVVTPEAYFTTDGATVSGLH